LAVVGPGDPVDRARTIGDVGVGWIGGVGAPHGRRQVRVARGHVVAAGQAVGQRHTADDAEQAAVRKCLRRGGEDRLFLAEGGVTTLSGVRSRSSLCLAYQSANLRLLLVVAVTGSDLSFLANHSSAPDQRIS